MRLEDATTFELGCSWDAPNHPAHEGTLTISRHEGGWAVCRDSSLWPVWVLLVDGSWSWEWRRAAVHATPDEALAAAVAAGVTLLGTQIGDEQ